MNRTFISVVMLLVLFAGAINSQGNSLNPDLTQFQKIDKLIKQNKQKDSQIAKLSQKLLNTQYKLNSALGTISTNNITINSLSKTNEALKKQKASLETQMLSNQKNTNESYRDEVHKYQSSINQNMNKTLAQFQETKQKLQNSNDNLNTQLVSTQKELEGAQHQISMEKKTLQSVNNMVTILTTQKQSLETSLENNLKDTTSAYKKQIADIKTKTQQQIEKCKDSYESLKTTNNQNLQTAKEEFVNKSSLQKQLYCRKIKTLIAKINSYENTLNKAATNIAKSTGLISTNVAKLRDAYKDVPVKNLKNTGAAATTELKTNNARWSTIAIDIIKLKKNLDSIKNVSMQLNQDNLNNKTILKQTNNDNKSLFSLF